MQHGRKPFRIWQRRVADDAEICRETPPANDCHIRFGQLRSEVITDGSAVGGFRIADRQQLFAVDRHTLRRFDAQPNLAAVDVNDLDCDVVANGDLFPEFS